MVRNIILALIAYQLLAIKLIMIDNRLDDSGLFYTLVGASALFTLIERYIRSVAP